MPAQVDAFRLAAKVLDEAGVTWWLSDGSVLGAVREGRFLPTDPDVDLGIWADDMPTVQAAFIEAGWPLTRIRPGQLWAAYSGVKVDIHGHQRRQHHNVREMVWYELGRGRLRYEFPAGLFHTLTPVTFCGVRTRMPNPAADYLVAHYGPDWRTPRARWRWNVDPPCLVKVR